MDEIAELPPHLQVKLLRVLQERCFERIGGHEVVSVDVRVIAATHQNLLELVRKKQFREDLYYRLNVVSMGLVPLRERKEDLPLLLGEMISKHAVSQGKNIEGYDDSFLEKLHSYDFPGNLRELENMVERAIVFCKNPKLEASLLTFSEPSFLKESAGSAPHSLDQFEKKIDHTQMIEAYYRAHGNKAEAARMMGMRESTYRYHLKKAFATTPQIKSRGTHG